VRVEIQRPSGDVIPGYSREECTPCQGDTLRHLVAWQGQSNLSQLQGQVVRLLFYLERARLYAFEFTG
jgi:hypothetical protein